MAVFDETKFNDILKQISPGTQIRDGLENILKARTGALLLVSDDMEIIKNLVDGGFFINEDFSPAKLYELAKMDGAIVLSKDFKKIYYANCQLIPSSHIPTDQTGTRHRTAQRTAIQSKELVICISQRRSIITLFKDEDRYVLEDTDVVLNKANQAVQTLERYKQVFDEKLKDLSMYEFNDMVTLENVIVVIQRARMVKEIKDEINNKIDELGDDGRLVKMQLEELTTGVESEERYIIQDYYKVNRSKNGVEKILNTLNELQIEEIQNKKRIAKILGYDILDSYDDLYVIPKGYRVLAKTPRMPININENIVKKFKKLSIILDLTVEQLDSVDGIGEIRAKNIYSSLKRMKETYIF